MADHPTPPATQEEAEKLAVKACGDYLSACRIAAGATEREQMGNYLMKLVSVIGVVMANAEGADVAFDRLLGTAQFVHKRMPSQPAKIVRMQ
jgi:hypothetical protein